MTSGMDMHLGVIWYAAASSDLGIVVRTNDPTKARAQLYHFRNQLNDPELKPLHIRVAPDNTEGAIWIIKGKAPITISLHDI
jgi:hypothetical protein